MEHFIEEHQKQQLTWKWNSQFTLDCFMKSVYNRLIVSSGDEALSLLVHSRRVKEDLEQANHFVQQYKNCGIEPCICVRKFEKELISHPELEFRAFVCKNKLTAISQYDYLSFYPLLKNNKDKICSLLCNFINSTVIPALSNSHETYICDLFVYPNFEKVSLIELNSFESWTGGCLFSWAENSEVLQNGPFEFRIVNEQVKQGKVKNTYFILIIILQ